MFELFVAAVVLIFAGSLVLAAALVRGNAWNRLATRVAAAWGITSVVLIGAAFANRQPPRPLPPADLPLEVTDDEYRSSDACVACHPSEYATWRGSYHSSMTQLATPESVLGNFDDQRLEFDGNRYRLFQENGEFFARIDSRVPDNPSAPLSRKVVQLEQLTGSHHMQIYWYATGRGRSLAALPLVYLVKDERWIPRKAAFLTAPGPGLHDMGNWNGVCISCHTTNPAPRVRDSRRRRADSHVAELGITCEACHGPGGEHVDANQSPLRRYRLHLTGEPDPTIVDPRELTHVRSSQICGQCHVIKTVFDDADFQNWLEHGSSFRPGDDLEQSIQIISHANRSKPGVKQLTESAPDFYRSTFWEGGSARVSGREYNGLLESPCFQRGEMSCLSCHTLHKSREDTRSMDEWADDQLKPGMRGDRACTQCHASFEEPEVATRHTNHPLSSAGSRCQNCHTPYSTYGLLKAIRSHQVDSPSVATDIHQGRPNACNLCHLDRSLGWTADALEVWYGTPPPELKPDQVEVAAGVLWTLEGDAGIRAITAWSMGWASAQRASGTSWVVPYLANLMNDSYDAVRTIAYRSVRTLPTFEDASFDPLDAPERRAEAIRKIRDRWAHSSFAITSDIPPADGRGERTLFDENGRILEHEFQRLLSGRDNRPVTLAE